MLLFADIDTSQGFPVLFACRFDASHFCESPVVLDSLPWPIQRRLPTLTGQRSLQWW